ncbi:hypothetical protein Tco_0336610 [Tanacetum coccineum]
MENPELQNPSYVLYDRVMEPLFSSQERKPRRDRGTRKGRTSTSSTPAFGEPSSSHPTNDDEDVDHNEVSSLKVFTITRRMHSNTSRILDLFCHEFQKLIAHLIPMELSHMPFAFLLQHPLQRPQSHLLTLLELSDLSFGVAGLLELPPAWLLLPFTTFLEAFAKCTSLLSIELTNEVLDLSSMALTRFFCCSL